MRRTLLACVAALALTAGRAEAVTIRDLIELTKAGLGDNVLFALIEVQRPVFTVDAATLKQLKEGGVSEGVIIAVINTSRARIEEPVQPVVEPLPEPHPQAPPPAPVSYPSPMAYPIPVMVPVYVPIPATAARRFDTRDLRDSHTIRTTINTDQGQVRAAVPLPRNCVKAEPVYWGFGGQLRPGSYAPPPMVVCR